MNGTLCHPQTWQQQHDSGDAGDEGMEDEEARAAAALDACCRCVENLGEQFYPSDNRCAFMLSDGPRMPGATGTLLAAVRTACGCFLCGSTRWCETVHIDGTFPGPQLPCTPHTLAAGASGSRRMACTYRRFSRQRSPIACHGGQGK
jgi:hypothetical protein